MAHEPLHPLDPRRRARRGEGPAPSVRGRAGKTGRGGRAGQGASGTPRAGKRRRRPAAPVDQGPPPGMVRIQKVLAQAGLASRRACEEMVLAGRVSVNGQLVSQLPVFVRPGQDRVTVDGKLIGTRGEPVVYILLNKPKGVVCTNADPAGRPRAVDLVAGVAQRVFPVGRLDADSTGILLMTNDGELANRVTHPRYGVEKTYVVEIDGPVGADAMEQLKSGSYLDGRRTAGAVVKVLRRSRQQTLLEIRLREGPNREVRRLLARLGYKVRNVRRVGIGPITDQGIKTGRFRMLAPGEVEALRRASRPGDQENLGTLPLFSSHGRKNRGNVP